MTSIQRFCVGMVVLVCAGPALANDPPAEHAVRYLLRADPSDLTSAVEYEVELALESDSWDSTGVDWNISTMTITRINSYGKGDASWIAVEPLAGLWSVQHADISDPQPEEFDITPLLNGTAAATNPNDEDLVFTFESALYDPIGPWPPVPTGALNYDFELAASQTTEAVGDDEPSEIDGGADPGEN